MGTRLYISAPTNVLEEILQVSEGSWTKMESIHNEFPNSSEEHYKAREEAFAQAEGTQKCYDFALFGFGKLNSNHWEFLKTIVKNEDDLYGASSEDPDVIERMLALTNKGPHLEAWLRSSEIHKISWS